MLFPSWSLHSGGHFLNTGNNVLDWQSGSTYTTLKCAYFLTAILTSKYSAGKLTQVLKDTICERMFIPVIVIIKNKNNLDVLQKGND